MPDWLIQVIVTIVGTVVAELILLRIIRNPNKRFGESKGDRISIDTQKAQTAQNDNWQRIKIDSNWLKIIALFLPIVTTALLVWFMVSGR